MRRGAGRGGAALKMRWSSPSIKSSALARHLSASFSLPPVDHRLLLTPTSIAPSLNPYLSILSRPTNIPNLPYGTQPSNWSRTKTKHRVSSPSSPFISQIRFPLALQTIHLPNAFNQHATPQLTHPRLSLWRYYATSPSPTTSPSTHSESPVSSPSSSILPNPTSISSANSIKSQPINITDKAVAQMHKVIAGKGDDEWKLRVMVQEGGCFGFNYHLEWTKQTQPQDLVLEKGGVKVLVDSVSVPLLEGSTLDFTESLMKSSFVIAENPNAGGACGCKTSFNIK